MSFIRIRGARGERAVPAATRSDRLQLDAPAGDLRLALPTKARLAGVAPHSIGRR
ncbi:MAG: hypothetical protein IPL41_10430 [Micropruina sp.]|nr:hypothetical protein [Micropruina sp.]